MANGYQDPWNTEYHGFYLSNAQNDGMDRGAIVMYSDGPNKVFGSEQTIANGVVTVTVKNGGINGQDDLSLITCYTYINGYGEVATMTEGFSNNQQFLTGNGGNGGNTVTPGGNGGTLQLPAENPTGDLQNYFDAEGWSSIKVLAQANLSKDDYKNKYGIEPGDTIVSNGTTYVLVDLGTDNDGDGIQEYDEDYDGFVFMYNTGIEKSMNSTRTNQGGYVSTGFEYINSTDFGKAYVDSLYTNLPDDGPNGLKANIKNVTITCNSGDLAADGTDTNGTSTYTTDAYLFLASYKEVGLTSNLTGTYADGYNAEGAKFDLFVDQTARANFASSDMANISSGWWLRSATSSTANDFYGVRTNGNSGNNYATATYAVVPAFVIG
jgi:hypothetical protein